MPDYVVPNLVNACHVLRLLADAPPPGLTALRISRQLSIPRTTAMRIAISLREGGLLKETDGHYALSPAMIPLGAKALENIDMRASAQPILRRLALDTDETSHLAIPAQDKSLLVEVVQSPHPIRVGAPAGTLAELYCSSTGKLFLAHIHRPSLAEIFKRIAPVRRTSRTILTAAAMEREIETILAQGFALDEEELYEGIRCLAAPVRDSQGRVIAAVGITGPSTRFTLERTPEVAQRVVAAANELSVAMGLVV